MRESIIEFEDPSSVPLALHLTGVEFGDRSLIVTKHHAVPQNKLNYSTQLPSQYLSLSIPIEDENLDEIARTIYVGNISNTQSEEQVAKFFSQCGPVVYVKMAGDIAHPARFAFVEFGLQSLFLNWLTKI